ncbi:MAG: HAD hydrolase-like protein [Lentisphaeraceae bacterium]|nr:HAD hydrolase-like protein [Lentisphaeraceae bacterium]
MHKKYSAYIFDLDGTLVSSSLDLARAVNKTRKFYNFEALSLDIVTSYIGDGAKKLVERSFPECDISYDTLLAKFLDYYRQGICIDTDFYPAIREFLEKLIELDIPAIVLTNKPQEMTDLLIKELKAEHLFKAWYGPDTFPRKPSPEGLIHSLDILEVTAENAVMIGDHHTDLMVGEAVGCDTIFCQYGLGNKGHCQPTYEIAESAEIFNFI